MAMKVEKVNYIQHSAYNKCKSAKSGMPSFQGSVPQQELVKELKNIIPPFMKVISKLSESIGEVQNIIINALCTGLVAPIFIKYNFLSKTDEDTRTYSAWRQPISAILAVATQAGMVAPFNSVIENMAYSGEYPEEYNLSNFKNENYIRKLIKKAEPNLTKDQLNKRVNEEIQKQHQELFDNIRNKNQILLKSANAPSKPLSEKAYRETLLDTINSLIKQDKNKLDSCKVKLEKRLHRSEYLSQNNGKAKAMLEEIKNNLDKNDNLSSVKNYLSTKSKSLKKEKADDELISMVQELLDRIKKINTPSKVEGKQVINPKQIIMEELRSKTNKMLAHVQKYNLIHDKSLIQEEVTRSVAEREKAFTKSLELLNSIKTDLTEGKNLTAADIEALLKEHSKGVSFKDSALHTNFIEEIITKYKNNINNNLKGHKQFTGLLISLAILPITCCLLNWVYPRFMDAVFPNLSNKKHDNESKDLIDKAPKKAGGEK